MNSLLIALNFPGVKPKREQRQNDPEDWRFSSGISHLSWE